MKILVVATKPPLPVIDGGRLVLWETLKGLAAAGAELRLLAPQLAPLAEADRTELASVAAPLLPSSRLRPWWLAAWRALTTQSSMALTRHGHPAVALELERQLLDWRPDVIHVEQLQALPQVLPGARAAGVPVLLRMQNVESDLWLMLERRPGWKAPLLRRAGRAVARDERRLLPQVARVLTLTAEDADRLRTISGLGDPRVQHHPPPFPAQWPAAAELGTTGLAPVVLSGSAGWWPNTQALTWFLERVFPLLPGGLAVHVHGGRVRPPPAGCAATLHWHPAPADSRAAFPANAVAAVPLLDGSGIRMRILEAWARGLPVVASAVAAQGLQAPSGTALLVPHDASPAAFASALVSASQDAGLRDRLVTGGRTQLRTRHDPAIQTAALLAHYRALKSASGADR